MNILDYLKQSEIKFPEKTALEDENEQISYKVLAQRAKSIGTVIANNINSCP